MWCKFQIYIIYLPWLVLSYCIPVEIKGQVIINELCASNNSIVTDPDFNEYVDWIELHNVGIQPFDLSGYYITDNTNNPSKWVIPSGTLLPAGGYLVIWADGRDTGMHASFRLDAGGEMLALYSNSYSLIDSISFFVQRVDISFGRSTAGDPPWGFFMVPTPGEENATSIYQGIEFSQPRFRTQSGLYESPVTVYIENPMGGEIRYTTDGSEATENSYLYQQPLFIDTTTILRARIFKAGFVPGPVVTRSYFIQTNSVDKLLPVVSLATAPENFWDPMRGIYVQNYKPLWEVPINIELFFNDGNNRPAFNLAAGAKINGLYSWQLPQKMLGIYCRGSYGSGSVEFPVTPQRQRNSFKTFALRASGSDWSYTLFRDMLGHHSCQMNMNLDIMGFRPSILYVNGKYMGIHNIREKVDADYIEKNHHLEPGSFDMVENEEFAEAGDLQAYQNLQELLHRDLTFDENFKAVETFVDLENLTDYLIAEMASGNTSIDHNVMAWKPKSTGKWKWILMDLDRGYFNPQSNLIDFYIDRPPLLLSELIVNQGWKQYFGKRLAAHMFTTFNPVRMRSLADGHASDIRKELPQHIRRWEGTYSNYGNPIPSMDYWDREVEQLKSFTDARPLALVNNLQKYGFEKPAKLQILCYPMKGGDLWLEGLMVPVNPCSGYLPRNTDFGLFAKDKAGYSFIAWTKALASILIPIGSNWAYYDSDVLPDTSWKEIAYDQSTWKYGTAQFGYGDGDEKTLLQKNINTCYFRKSFIVSDSILQAGILEIRILRDDGAVIWLNGKELLRSNIAAGELAFNSLPVNGVYGPAETEFHSYFIDPSLLKTGTNLLAVQVFRAVTGTIDMSFDLSFVGWFPDWRRPVSYKPDIKLSMQEDSFLIANFQRNNFCLVPEIIDRDLHLTVACSPYKVQGDIHVMKDATLFIDPGVEIHLPTGTSILVEGAIHATGTEGKEIIFQPDSAAGADSWGGLVIRNSPDTSFLSHLIVIGASTGQDRMQEDAAVSVFRSHLVMDHVVIGDVFHNPVKASYGSIKISNCKIHSRVTGDLIHCRYGNASVEKTILLGNDQTDTDGIDYDEIQGGIIRNTVLQNFEGINSDAIDIGEESKDLVIDSIIAVHIKDKGVSVGQFSSVRIQNSVFLSCDMGIALKDSCQAEIMNCLFYGNNYGVAGYEKNLGSAGGNGNVQNSLISNSSIAPVSKDAKSRIQLSYTLSDNDQIEGGEGNINENPLFRNPGCFDFSLKEGSPAYLAGKQGNERIDIGIQLPLPPIIPPVTIHEFFLSGTASGLPEFIGLINHALVPIDLTGYKFTQGIFTSFPAGEMLQPGERIYLTLDPKHPVWSGFSGKVYPWEDGRLNNEGERLLLVEKSGITADFLSYRNDGLWPVEGFSDDKVFVLRDPCLDNHHPENWTVKNFSEVISTGKNIEKDQIRIFPNPSNGNFTIMVPGSPFERVQIYTVTGILIREYTLDGRGIASCYLGNMVESIYWVRAGNAFGKIILTGK